MSNPHHYVDKNGETVLFIDSDIPGLTIVPDGFTAADAVHLEQDKAAAVVDKFVQKGKDYKEPDFLGELTKLRNEIDNQKNEIAQLKQKK